MHDLQRLRADHAPNVFDFELANRSYFATSISDRGNEYFQHFTEQHNSEIAEQETGTCIYHVLVDADGRILGRFNLYEIHDGTAIIGYRIAKNAAGRGVATTTVQRLCELAATQYGLRRLRAATTHENIASQKVLAKSGFVPDGPAEPGGRAGTWYLRILSDDCGEVH